MNLWILKLYSIRMPSKKLFQSFKTFWAKFLHRVCAACSSPVPKCSFPFDSSERVPHRAQQARSARNVKKPQINGIVLDMSIWVMIEQNNSNFELCKLYRICYAKSQFRLYHMTYKFDSVIHDLAVCKNFVNIVTFGLSVTCTYRTLLNACVKKDEHLENQKYYLNQK